MITTGLAGLDGATPDVLIVGAGPVGISMALVLARSGRSVVLLESGGPAPELVAQALSDAEIVDPNTHVSMAIGVQRSLGGASNLWGGRCVSFDPQDFETRPAIPHSGWPISFSDIAPHMQEACDLIGCGQNLFDVDLPGFDPKDDDFSFRRLERWSLEPRFDLMYAETLKAERNIDLRFNATATRIDFAEDGSVARVNVEAPGGARAALAPTTVVLAAGALESTRLLLAAQADAPARFGGEEGPLGRFYMGHLYAIAAEMTLTSDAVDGGIDYFRNGVNYVRRRFMPSADLQRRLGLTNVALWPDYPLIRDPIHRNGILSLAYLALSVPPLGRQIVAESIRQHYVGHDVRRLPHILNILRDLPSTAAFVPSFFYGRYFARPRKPGFFQRNAGRRYAVRFHAEHLPDPTSRVTLSGARDATGLPRLKVDLKYSREDVEPLLRTHDAFADWLQRTGIGRMHWLVPREERVDYILKQCYDGHHQIGTVRMAASERTGVVDSDCRVFGSSNLFVAGSAVYPTSSQANPTLTAVTIGVRLAKHLTGRLAAAPAAGVAATA